MIVRLGYVSISKTLENKVKFQTMNYTNFLKNDRRESMAKLHHIIENNLITLRNLIDYNIKNNIHFYRITSNLIPLATLDEVNIDYTSPFQSLYDEIGNKIRSYSLRVDMHPSEYTVLNTVKSEVFDNTMKILTYHEKILSNLGVQNPILILHVGSSVFGKKASLTRFVNNFFKLPDTVKKGIAIENDDKIFTVSDVLELCSKLNIPMVLDVHHNRCLPSSFDLSYYLSDIFKTWGDFIPKVHFSSPKNHTKKDFRSHHDYIEVNDFVSFLESAKDYTDALDVMLEAKMKDEALFRLVRELKYQTDYEFIDDTTFIVK